MYDWIKRQAALYGQQVRWLEDHHMIVDRARVYEAWVTFRRQFVHKPGAWALANNHYYNAYSDQ